MQQEKSTNVYFAHRLVNLMGEMPNTDLAKIAGVTPTAAGNYISGRVPRADILKKIADHFGVTMESLLTPIRKIQFQKQSFKVVTTQDARHDLHSLRRDLVKLQRDLDSIIKKF